MQTVSQQQVSVDAKPLLSKRALDLNGVRVGRLNVLEPISLRSHGSVLWHCQCDCGEEVYVAAHRLKNRKVRKCSRNCSATTSTNQHRGLYPFTRNANNEIESAKPDRVSSVPTLPGRLQGPPGMIAIDDLKPGHQFWASQTDASGFGNDKATIGAAQLHD